MKDEVRTEDKLVNELRAMRQRITELEATEAQRKRSEEELKRNSEKLRKATEDTLYAMAFLAEIRDPYTAGHQREVANLACAIAKEMNLSEDEIKRIRIAGAVHDVGRIDVAAEILNKPARLTKKQFSVVKHHPTVGYIVFRMEEFPWPIAEIVLQHHERKDGSGYPQGLSGKEILLEARILAVADVVEAMSSHRAYRPVLGIDKALDEISRNRDTLYDPPVVDASLKLFTEKGFTFERSRRNEAIGVINN